MIIRNLIVELHPELNDDMQVEAFEDPTYSEEAIEYFIKRYWNRQDNWVKTWTLEMLEESDLDHLDEELLFVLKESK